MTILHRMRALIEPWLCRKGHANGSARLCKCMLSACIQVTYMHAYIIHGYTYIHACIHTYKTYMHTCMHSTYIHATQTYLYRLFKLTHSQQNGMWFCDAPESSFDYSFAVNRSSRLVSRDVSLKFDTAGPKPDRLACRPSWTGAFLFATSERREWLWRGDVREDSAMDRKKRSRNFSNRDRFSFDRRNEDRSKGDRKQTTWWKKQRCTETGMEECC